MTVHLTQGQPDSRREMSWDDLIYILDFCYANNYKEITYILDDSGIHHDFPAIVVYTAKRMFNVCVKANSNLQEWLIKKLHEEIAHSKVNNSVRFIFRINGITNNDIQSLAICLFETFPNKVTFEYVINSNTIKLSFALDLIARYKLKQEIKLHFAPESQPSINLEDLHKYTARLNNWIPQFIAAGVIPIFDRSLPICSFTDELLGKCCRAKVSFSWHTPPDVEVFPELAVHAFYRSIMDYSVPLLQFNTIAEVENYFINIADGKRILNSCDQCNYIAQGLCCPAIYLL